MICQKCGGNEFRVIVHYDSHDVFEANEDGVMGEVLFGEQGDETERFGECSKCYTKYEMDENKITDKFYGERLDD
jgi:hypothetical protein